LRVVPRLKVLFISEKSLSVKETDLREIFRKASRSVCPSTVEISPDPLSPPPSTSSSVRTIENS
jgi:hypothetical protein